MQDLHSSTLFMKILFFLCLILFAKCNENKSSSIKQPVLSKNHNTLPDSICREYKNTDTLQPYLIESCCYILDDYKLGLKLSNLEQSGNFEKYNFERYKFFKEFKYVMNTDTLLLETYSLQSLDNYTLGRVLFKQPDTIFVYGENYIPRKSIIGGYSFQKIIYKIKVPNHKIKYKVYYGRARK